jgi:hypothetical protein
MSFSIFARDTWCATRRIVGITSGLCALTVTLTSAQPTSAFRANDAETASSTVTPRATTSHAAPDEPLSGRDRIGWAVRSSVGPKSLGAGVVSAAWGVARDSPDEYGANWRGFGKRYALRLSGVTLGNSIEAGLGAIWDEDPRYVRVGSGPVWARVKRAGIWTVLASDTHGHLRPAYARAIGNVGNNFITNAWRVESDSSVTDAVSRSAVGITSRFVSNLFDEFWPDVRRHVLRRP